MNSAEQGYYHHGCELQQTGVATCYFVTLVLCELLRRARGTWNVLYCRRGRGAAQGSADCRRNWTTALIPRSPGYWNSFFQCGEAARIVWGSGRYKLARSAMSEQGRTRTGIASLPHIKLSLMSAPGPTCERQEHLDAVVSFAGAGQRRCLFQALTFSRSSGPLETHRKSAASCSTLSRCS